MPNFRWLPLKYGGLPELFCLFSTESRRLTAFPTSLLSPSLSFSRRTSAASSSSSLPILAPGASVPLLTLSSSSPLILPPPSSLTSSSVSSSSSLSLSSFPPSPFPRRFFANCAMSKQRRADKRHRDDESGGESDDEQTDEKKLRLLEKIRQELPPIPDVKLEQISEEVVGKLSPPIRKRKVAMLVAYCGSGYFGLQIQSDPELRTIEGDFHKALENSGLITAENAKDLKTQTGFQRASRTDKGVSAAGNVFSLKIKHSDDALERINKCLPPQIKVLGIIKVTKGFDSKNSVNSRTYLYLLPTFSFASRKDEMDVDFRVKPEVLDDVNKLLSLYKGTRNFHNFTSGKLPTDASAKRFVMDVSCGCPFVVDGMEFCVISVRGQSFMLHQIRKMIGLVIAVVRKVCGPECLTVKVWGPAKVDIPKAPGLGLMLDKLHYDTYNRKFGNDGLHQALDWDDYKDEMEAFKLEQVFANIARTEIEAMEMKAWLETLPIHSYDVKSGREIMAEAAAKDAADGDVAKADAECVARNGNDIAYADVLPCAGKETSAAYTDTNEQREISDGKCSEDVSGAAFATTELLPEKTHS